MKQIVIAVAIGVVAVAASLVYAQSRDDETDARALSGTTLDGQAFDLASTRGAPAVVNFFASWCPPCNVEAPDLVAFSTAHPDASVVGVAVNDQRADTEDFVEKYGVAYPVVYDPEGGLGEAWGVTGIPTTFFLDADGAVVDTIVGAATLEQFEASLAKAQ